MNCDPRPIWESTTTRRRFALGSSDVLQARLDGHFDRSWATEHFAGLQPTIAAVNVSVMDPVLPDGWTKVATWTREAQLIPAGSNVVGFYAPVDRAAGLRAGLEQYEDRMPPLTRVAYEG